MLGLECEGQVFHDRFLIADIVMSSGFPAERRFWFDPPFHRNQSALLHRQADDVWRIDFQLGWDADPESEKQPERIVPRIRAMLGDDAQFEIEWASVYTFQCRRMRSFRHGRVLFAGDAAHLVSPFGARGANSGIQDADNLAWKLELVLAGQAPERLLDSYDAERAYAADENIRHSTRSTDFITPKSDVSRTFRDAVLGLAKRHPFARALVNSGRLSQPCVLSGSPLSTPDGVGTFAGGPVPGAVAVDAPVAGPRGSWLLGYLDAGFELLVLRRRRACRRSAFSWQGRHRVHGRAGGRVTGERRLPDRGQRRSRGQALRRADPALATCCAPTSMSAHAGAHSSSAPCARRSSARRPKARKRPR